MPQPLMGLTGQRKCVRVTATAPSPAVAAPLVIQASVGVGGKNQPADVSRIQEALNRVPPPQGGPTPPLAVDGWIGPKTNAAIQRFQVTHFGAAKADGRVDPDQYTIAKLREFQTTPGPAAGCGCPPKGGGGFALASEGRARSSVDAGSTPSFMDRVYDTLPVCSGWVLRALECLRQGIRWKTGRAKSTELVDCMECLGLLHRCFKVNDLTTPDAVRAMEAIRLVFLKMTLVISTSAKGVQYFHLAPPGSEKDKNGTTILAFTYHGGFTRRDEDGKVPMSHPEYEGPNLPTNGIYMCEPSSGGMGKDGLADLLIHEMAHFAGPESKPDRIEDPSGGLAALELNHHTSMRSATNYAWLAWLARLPRSEWMTNKG